MTITLFLVTTLFFSDLHKIDMPLSDVFIEKFHGAAHRENFVAILNFSQMKTKLLIVNTTKQTAHEIEDPRLKIFGSRKVIPYKRGFLVIGHKVGYYITTDLEFEATVQLDAFEGRPPEMLWSGIQPIQNNQFLCRFIGPEGLHIFSVLDIDTQKFLPLHEFQSQKHYTFNLFKNAQAYFALHNKTGSVVAFDTTFKSVRKLLPELQPIKRKKNSRFYRRNPFQSLIHVVFADATAVWFDIYPPANGNGDVIRKRYKLQDGTLQVVSDNLVTLARFNDKTLILDTEEGTLTLTTTTL